MLEKDIWVCWALHAVFDMPGRMPLAFKGGTSLSKVFNAIQRFSEDIDLTIDYTALCGSRDPLASEMSGNAIKKLSEELRAAVGDHIRNTVAPHIIRLAETEIGVTLTIEISDDGETARVRYSTSFDPEGSYMAEGVLLEFGGRNTTLPNETHAIKPYAADHVEKLAFPIANVVVLSPMRTFWEKATLIHAECQRPERQASLGAERLSRHWYDLALLVRHDIGAGAVKDRDLLAQVARLKGIFYRSRYANYPSCLEGRFRLIPDAPLRGLLERDYSAMMSEGMFFESAPPFNDIMVELRSLEQRLNTP